jgi:hypothetical protein
LVLDRECGDAGVAATSDGCVDGVLLSLIMRPFRIPNIAQDSRAGHIHKQRTTPPAVEESHSSADASQQRAA